MSLCKSGQESLVWEHNRWESVVREHLHNFDFISVDEVLRHIMSTISDDLTEASAVLENIFENDYDSFMTLVEDVLDYISADQRSKDNMHDTDYGWLKDVLSPLQSVLIDFKYAHEDTLDKFLDFVVEKTADYSIQYDQRSGSPSGGGEISIVVRGSNDSLKTGILGVFSGFTP